MIGPDKAGFSFGPTQFSTDAVAKYCLASGDTNPIHVDPQAALRAGLASCIVPGGMLVFLMEQAISTSFPQATIIEMRTRFTAPLLTGNAVLCDGREIQRRSTHGRDDTRLMRLSCRDEARRILCLGDVLFTLVAKGTGVDAPHPPC